MTDAIISYRKDEASAIELLHDLSMQRNVDPSVNVTARIMKELTPALVKALQAEVNRSTRSQDLLVALPSIACSILATLGQVAVPRHGIPKLLECMGPEVSEACSRFAQEIRKGAL